MSKLKKILVDASSMDNIQVAVVNNNKLENLEYESSNKKYIKGNLYLARVTRVEPSLQAAFIDYGAEKHGFISFAEIHSGYYNIPHQHKRSSEDSEPEERALTEIPTVAVDRQDSDAPIDGITLEDEDVDSEEDSDQMASAEDSNLEKIKQQNVEKYKIQEVIKHNQVLLVQAIKEERGNKGASFTTYISLAGRFCVIMPNSTSQGGGVSRKISDPSERHRLQSIIEEINQANTSSLIIRTIGQKQSKTAIKNDFNYLASLWNTIREKTLKASAPAFIHAEDDILKKVIRDLYDDDTSEIIVQGKQAYKELQNIVHIMSSVDNVPLKLFEESAPVFSKFGVDEHILNLYNPVAYMESGAYIVINHTEALIAIDVNSGRATSEKNIEGTALKTNLEAAKEIARQISLRNLSGLLVIDFIDMVEARNRKLVERALREHMQDDKARVQLGYISNFGLLEMSRQRLKPSFLESSTVVCNYCRGRGVIKSNDINSITIFRTIISEINKSSSIKALNIYTCPDVTMYLLNNKRSEVYKIEKEHGIQLFFNQDPSLSYDSFAIEAIKKHSHSHNAHAVEAEHVVEREKGESTVFHQPQDEDSRGKRSNFKKRNRRKPRPSERQNTEKQPEERTKPQHEKEEAKPRHQPKVEKEKPTTEPKQEAKPSRKKRPGNNAMKKVIN